MEYAAYNHYGDLITTAYTYDLLIDKLWRMGWLVSECFIGKVGIG